MKRSGTSKIIFFILISASVNSWANPTQFLYRAVWFLPFSKLADDQRRLILPWVSRGNPEVQFSSWSRNREDLASSFLSITHALEQFMFYLGPQEAFRAIDLIENVNSIEGDRIRVKFNKNLFIKWKNLGGPFSIRHADGKVETGFFNFEAGNKWGGSLHTGYDIQGFTSSTDLPRLQINYRWADSEADIDLDAFRPFFGFIPNPRHLTWENSDVRYWIKRYIKKFGNPGFKIEPVRPEMSLPARLQDM